jgi:hypothetical protein
MKSLIYSQLADRAYIKNLRHTGSFLLVVRHLECLLGNNKLFCVKSYLCPPRQATIYFITNYVVVRIQVRV